MLPFSKKNDERTTYNMIYRISLKASRLWSVLMLPVLNARQGIDLTKVRPARTFTGLVEIPTAKAEKSRYTCGR